MDAREVEYEALRRMTPARKLAVMNSLVRRAYELKAAGLRHMRPDLSDERILARVRDLMGRDRS